MGFFGAVSRIIQGKPVFEVPTGSQAQSSKASSADTEIAQQDTTSKVLPTVLVERCESHVSGSHIRVMAHIKNHSDQQVELDKIRLLGTSTELDTVLRPGESREFKVYDGRGMNGSSYDDAHVIYKDMSGDYFESYHTVQFRKENDGTYSPQQFRFVGPVKDI